MYVLFYKAEGWGVRIAKPARIREPIGGYYKQPIHHHQYIAGSGASSQEQRAAQLLRE